MAARLVSPAGEIVLGPAEVTIGRGNDNQLVVTDAQASTHHAAIRLIGDGQHNSITDLGSTNGTFVNEQRLDHSTVHLLHAGDRIRIGETTFIYEAHGHSQLASTTYAYAGQGAHADFERTVLAARPPAYGVNTAYGWKAQPDTSPSSPYGPAIQPSYVPPQSYYGQPSAAPPPPLYPSVDNPPYQPVAQPSYDQPAVVSPPLTSPLPPRKQQSGRGLKIALIGMVVFVVLGAITGAFFLLTPHLQPVMSVSSDYRVGATPAGSSGTIFHVSGQQFSSNAAVTFLLDGTPIPGNGSVQSDAHGNVRIDLTVTDGWVVGKHTLTGRDANNFTTKAGVVVVIVPQGQAHTPGPNGAPANDTSFSLKVTIQRQNASTGKHLQSWNQTLLISSRPDPAGGTVCQSSDDGQSHTINGDMGNGITYTETSVWTCSGTYKGGKLSYTETVTSDTFKFSTGVSCTANVPYSFEHLEGSFTDHSTISGTYTGDALYLNCDNGKSFTMFDAEEGSWTGTAA
jgi:FHA domain